MAAGWFIFLALALSIFTAWQVLWPLMLPDTGIDAGAEDSSPHQEQKARIVQMLRDLDLDHSTGKVSDEEHQKMKMAMSAELASVLEKIDAESRR